MIVTQGANATELDRLTPDGLAALERAMLAGQQEAGAVAESRFVDLHAVPLVELEQVQAVFSWLDSKFPIAWKQQVRQLRATVTQFHEELRGRREAGLQVLALTSLNGLRSRQTLAANLAYALASVQDGRVLLIDAKFRKPELERAMSLGGVGLEGAGGICEATRGRREEIPALMRRVRGTQLYLMPTGQVSRFELEPVDVEGLTRVLAGLRKQFAWIVVDAPGFDTPADAMTMTQVADGTVLVVERERDRFEAVGEALRQTKGRYVLGAVLL
jgi:Mrp family chromosome partitioning ATPase